MNVIFMGTPSFALPALQALAGAHQVTAVVTQPDKPKGRGKKLQAPPVKQLAQELGIPVLQPEKAKDPAFLEKLKMYPADVIVVAAYGQILPKTILTLPRYGAINIHGSLLPKYRGAGPIQWAIVNGEKETGVTIMQMAEGLDSGDMMAKVVLPIGPEDTYGSLTEKMAQAGAKLLLTTLEELQAGQAHWEKQVEEESTYAPMIEKSMGKIDWTKHAHQVDCLIRGLSPQPGAHTLLEGAPLKVLQSQLAAEDIQAKPGEVIETGKAGICVACGQGAVLLTVVQSQGKKAMPADAFLRGHGIAKGTVLG